jgi:medium-chain acyl-[acyl-carrier-protein] hydrolase
VIKPFASIPAGRSRLRLFCLPFAGGSSVAYRDWQAHLPADIRVHAIELPGRGARLAETPLTSIQAMAGHALSQMEPHLGAPYAIWGHSMGALVSYELVRAIETRTLPRPMAVFVSAHRAPHLPDRRTFRVPRHLLPESELIELIAQLNGTPRAVLEDQDMRALLARILRADFEAIETYRPPLAAVSVRTRLHAVGGDADPVVEATDIVAWRAQAAGEFDTWIFEGDHFYAFQPRFVQTLSAMLCALIAPLEAMA